jgi:hypothetical protein
VLRTDSSGSEDDGDSIPVEVALQALNEEKSEEGWTPVVRRSKKTEKEAVGDFWREIGFPTPLSRYWETTQRSRSPAGTPLLFCRSVDVYAASSGVEKLDGSPAVGSPPAGSVCRGAASSPSGLRIARSPRMGPWRGPLPKRRITPSPILGHFLDKAIETASTPVVAGPSLAPVQLGAAIACSTPGAEIVGGTPVTAIAGVTPCAVIAGGSSGAVIAGGLQSHRASVSVDGVVQSPVHAPNRTCRFPWAHLRRRYRYLWVRSCPSEADRVYPAAASSITPSPSSPVSASIKLVVVRPRRHHPRHFRSSLPRLRPPDTGAPSPMLWACRVRRSVRPPRARSPRDMFGLRFVNRLRCCWARGGLPHLVVWWGFPHPLAPLVRHRCSRLLVSWDRRRTCHRSTCPMCSTRRSSSSRQCYTSHMFSRGISSCLFLLRKLSRCLSSLRSRE